MPKIVKKTNSKATWHATSSSKLPELQSLQRKGCQFKKNEGMVHSFLKGNQVKRNTCMLMIQEHSYVLISYFGKRISNSFEPLFYQQSIFFLLLINCPWSFQQGSLIICFYQVNTISFRDQKYILKSSKHHVLSLC